MKTPKEISDNLKKNIITDKMLALCLYSFNKRAKNYRDKKNEIRHNQYYGFFRYSWDDIVEEKEKEYYKKKSDILYYLKPVCIHRQRIDKRTRVYDNEASYKDLYKEYCEYYKKLVALENEDKKNGYDWDNDEYSDKTEKEFIELKRKYKVRWCNCFTRDFETTWFVDIFEDDYLYFLYYEIDEFSFHSPIKKNEVNIFKKKYSIEIEDIDDDFSTEGLEVTELLSNQVCTKIYNLFIEQQK